MDTENLEDFANKVANYLKVNGKFDEFRKKCASEIEQHVSFVKARKEVDELVRLRVVNNRKSQCPLTKNQLRHEIRTLLSKRKDLLAAADSSIQFSLRNNKELFATEINDVTALFEEEEKAEAEAKKLEQSEKAVQENQDVDNVPVAEAAEVDIPPPPPPPPPPVPIAPTARATAALPTISGTDTALLIQESVFHNDVLSGPSHSSASHTMNITDLLANVQSSDFAAQQVSPQPVERERETPSYPTYQEPEPTSEVSHSPKNTPADTIIIMSKQDVAKEIYNFEKEEKQFSNYIKEDEDYDKNKYPDEVRDYKYVDHSRYDYPDYKRSSSSYKTRKHGEEYRERSSSSKHRERSASPGKYSERYKEYSARDYGHSMDRMFKSPEYYLSISRSSSSRSSTKESSRDRRKREEEWYQKYGYSSKYSHSMYGSHKYSESSRRDEYYKEYYDKRRHDDPYYKSSERSKSRDYALYEASKGRDSTHDPYKMRDAAYEISKIRQSTSSESSKFKEPPYVPSKYHEHELIKSRERDLLYRERMKEDAYSSSMDIRERRPHLDRPFENLEKYSPGDIKLKPPVKVPSPARSPLDNPRPPTPEKSHSPEKDPSPPSLPIPDEEPSNSRNDLDDLLERAISNIPKTPEDPSPISSIKDETAPKEEPTGVAIESNIDHHVGSPVKLPSPSKSLPKSPQKPIVCEIEEDLTEFEMQVRETKVNDSSRRALIESILPKPKYCSILKETFALSDGDTIARNDDGANNDFTCKEISSAEEVRESSDAKTSNSINDLKQATALNADCESRSPIPLHIKVQPTESKPTALDDCEPECSNEEKLIRHDNQDFPVPSLPPLPPPPPVLPLVQHSALLPPSLPKTLSSTMSHAPQIPSLPQATAVSIAMPSTQPTAGKQSPHSPLSLQQAIAHQTTLGISRGIISPPMKTPLTPPHPPPSPPPPPPPPPPSGLATCKISSSLGDIKKATPAQPIVLSTTRKKEKANKPNDSSDAEEGEILSDTDEPAACHNTALLNVQENITTDIQDSAVEDTNKVDEITNKENEDLDIPQSDSQSSSDTLTKSKELTPQPPEPKVFVPDENFPIRSKRDLFKARFFQPDMKIDFAKPDQVTDNNSKPDSSLASEKEDSEKSAAPPVVEMKPNPEDNMRYSRKMRFKEVLKQHISEQENTKEQQLKESQQRDNMKEVVAPESGASSQQSVPAVEPDVSAVSLIGKRKRFLNDYIASLESNPPPTKSIKTEEASVEESLPKLRIKPISGGSYSSETLSSTSSAPPPLHKASTSPDKEAVPKCIIKLGKGHWNACETEKSETTGKRKGRAASRPNLRSREASTDSSKSEIAEKPRTTRSKKTRKAVKSYNVEEDEKNSDNSFEEVDNSRRSGRTRKTIKRLNL